VRRVLRLDIPLVLCTSKTRAELRALFPALGAACPAVVEDGGGLLLPPRTIAGAPLPDARRTRDGRLLPLALPYARVRRVFRALRRATGGAVVGMGDLSVAEVARITGLAPAAARRARQREFDEPFVFVRDARRHTPTVRRLAARAGLVVSRGGRFWHLHGPTDKGSAARVVRALLERERGPLRVIALGDSALDAPLLRAADVAVIVPRPDGRPDPALRRALPDARVAPAPGPAGWARAVQRLLREAGE
jgi:mannosyl-3-phosphoglycerate phosphatase